MKRAIATGVALLTTIGFTAVVTAQGPVQRESRFQQRRIPASFDLGNLPSQTDPEKVVTAVIVLSADSVGSVRR
jgi:hypothetical protein